jgi:hypothetical protein
MDLDRHEGELREALDAATGKYRPPDLVLISPEIGRRKLRQCSALPWLRKLSWAIFPNMLGTALGTGLVALIVLVWRHVI